MLEELPVNEHGGTIRVELNHTSTEPLPEAFRVDANDHRILTVANNLAIEGLSVTLVSKDLPLRLKAGVVGLDAAEYRDTEVADGSWTGYTDFVVGSAVIDEFYDEGVVDLDDARQLPVNTGITLVSGSQSGLGRLRDDKRVHRIADRSVFDVRPRSREQHIALDLLTDDSIGIVSLGGRAGTGKSVLALAAALESVLENRTHSKVIVFRPLYAVGGQDLGYLPGSEAEKMSPWAAAVGDALEAIAGPEVVDEVSIGNCSRFFPDPYPRPLDHRRIHHRRRSANLERNVLLTALTRIGENSKVVLTHDVAQRDNLRVGRFDGIGQSSTICAAIRSSVTSHSPAANAAPSLRWWPACSTATAEPQPAESFSIVAIIWSLTTSSALYGRIITLNSVIQPSSSHVMMSTPFTYMPSTVVSNSSTA